jgi:hypothetical protein
MGALADNGGPTHTHLLQADSPAVNAGEPAWCAHELVGVVDQRGVTRPQGAGCDIGAFGFEVDLYQIFLPLLLC